MATPTRIQIKNSTTKDLPDAAALLNGELAYSYASGKIFVGSSDGQSSLIIGGKTYTDLFSAHVAEDGTVTKGVAAENQAVILGTNKTLDVIDLGLLRLNGIDVTPTATSINLLTGFDEIVTDNTLSVVSDTKLITAKAIKEYVISRTDAAVSTFEFDDIQADQLLIAQGDGKFKNIPVSGALELLADGSTDIADEWIQNRHIAAATIANDRLVNPTFTIGTTTIALGETKNININEDTSGVLRVNKGGTGSSSHDEHAVLLGSGVDAVRTDTRFTYNATTAEFKVEGDTTLKGDVAITPAADGSAGNLNVADALSVGGNASVTGTLGVTADATFGSNVGITGNSTLSGTLSVGQTLDVTGVATLSDALNVTGATALSDTLSVTGATSLNSTLDVAGVLTAADNVLAQANLTVDGTSQFNNDVTIGTDDTARNATIKGDLLVTGDTTVNGNSEVDGDLQVTGNLLVSGNTVSIDVQTLTVEDNIIQVGKGNEGDNTDLGVAAEYKTGDGSTRFAGYFRDHTNGIFTYFDGYDRAPGVTMEGYDEASMLATLKSKLISPDVQISGGMITDTTLENCIINCGTF